MGRTEATGAGDAIFGIFRTDDDAARALDDLQAAGVPLESISVAMRDQRAIEAVEPADQPAVEGAARGIFGGGALGAAIGGLVGLASIVVPGLFPLVVVGPLSGLLGGALTGGAIGGIAGALTRLGAPKHHAQWYEEQLGHGAILVVVHEPGDPTRVSEIVRGHSGVSVGLPGVVAAGFEPEQARPLVEEDETPTSEAVASETSVPETTANDEATSAPESER